MKKKNKGIFIILILLFIFISAIGIYSLQLLGKVNKVEISEIDEELGIKEEVVDQEDNEDENNKVINIALFGVDVRSSSEKARADSIMIASLDKEHKKIKLTSIMRDTYVNIPDRGMDKINHAYAFGGPELTLKTINQNFDMNIREFATVNFQGLEDIIDSLGGIEIDIKANEVNHVPRSFDGTQVLDGEQALSYSRIRMVGDGDYERTERQRTVLEKIINKGLNSGLMQYPKILNNLLPHVDTSLSKAEMLKLGTSIFTSNIRDIEKFRVPLDDYSTGKLIKEVFYIVPETLEDNVIFLHEFIYD